ncbi:Uncharacterised protein [Providencia stuartii]|nr:Uncharacterised protein [Providencia stuartii]
MTTATLLGHRYMDILAPLDMLLSYSQRKKYSLASADFPTQDNHEKVHNWLLKTTWYAHPNYHFSLTAT